MAPAVLEAGSRGGRVGAPNGRTTCAILDQSLGGGRGESERGGDAGCHTSVAVVLDRYRHLFPAEIEHTTGRLEAMFAPVNVPPDATVTALQTALRSS